VSKHVLIYEVAIQEIVKLIVSNGLQPGEKLPAERDLAKMLNISRACIREALQVLSSNYIVQIKAGSGIYVNILDEAVLGRYVAKEVSKGDALLVLKNIAELRLVLETHGFQQVAKIITPEQLHRLYSHEAVEFTTMQNYDSLQTGTAMAGMDLEQLILSFQPNTLLTSTHGRLNVTWKSYMNRIDSVALPPDIRHRDHINIIMAIESKSSKQIAKAVSVHLDGTVQAIEKLTQALTP